MSALTNRLPAGWEHARAQLREDVLAGLAASPRRLPAKHAIDKVGGVLSDQLHAEPESYVARAEAELLQGEAEILAPIERHATLIALGVGLHEARLLLDRAAELGRLVPIDDASARLAQATIDLRRRYPKISIEPVAGDYEHGLPPHRALWPPPEGGATVYFGRAQIGRFAPESAVFLLRDLRRIAGQGGSVIVVTDPGADPERARRALDDAAGVSSRLARNLLARIDRELGADFDPSGFDHEAVWQPAERRVEERLVSRGRQRARIGGAELVFDAGERIVLGHEYKYPAEDFVALLRDAGLVPLEVWRDPGERIVVHLARVETRPSLPARLRAH